LELPKWKANKAILQTPMDKWLAYLTNSADNAEMEEIAMNEPAIKKALKAEEIFLKRDKERYLYEMREKALHDYASAISYAKEEGILKGRVEEKRETAVRLLAMGLSVADVSAGTGLAIDEVEKLKQN